MERTTYGIVAKSQLNLVTILYTLDHVLDDTIIEGDIESL